MSCETKRKTIIFLYLLTLTFSCLKTCGSTTNGNLNASDGFNVFSPKTTGSDGEVRIYRKVNGITKRRPQTNHELQGAEYTESTDSKFFEHTLTHQPNVNDSTHHDSRNDARRPHSNGFNKRSLDLDAGYQSDSAGHGVPGKVYGPPSGSSSLTTDEWQAMRPVVQCSGGLMTLTAKGREYTHLLVDRVDSSPISLLHLPANCGYSVTTKWRDLIVMVPYNGCYVTRENGSYVLPLLWWGSRVKISCPMASPPEHATLGVLCDHFGIAVNVEGTPDVMERLAAKVNGGWVPLVSEACAYRVYSHPEDLIIFAPFVAPCVTLKDGGRTLVVFLGGKEVALSCPVHLPPLPPHVPFPPSSPAPTPPSTPLPTQAPTPRPHYPPQVPHYYPYPGIKLPEHTHPAGPYPVHPIPPTLTPPSTPLPTRAPHPPVGPHYYPYPGIKLPEHTHPVGPYPVHPIPPSTPLPTRAPHPPVGPHYYPYPGIKLPEHTHPVGPYPVHPIPPSTPLPTRAPHPPVGPHYYPYPGIKLPEHTHPAGPYPVHPIPPTLPPPSTPLLTRAPHPPVGPHYYPYPGIKLPEHTHPAGPYPVHPIPPTLTPPSTPLPTRAPHPPVGSHYYPYSGFPEHTHPIPHPPSTGGGPGHSVPFHHYQSPIYYLPQVPTTHSPTTTAAPPPTTTHPLHPPYRSYCPYYDPNICVVYPYLYQHYHPHPPTPTAQATTACPLTTTPSVTQQTQAPIPPTLPPQLSPSLTCMAGHMVVFLPSAHNDTIKVKDVRTNTWLSIASAPAICNYMLKMTSPGGFVLAAPLPACHTHPLSPSVLTLSLQFWDIALLRYRTLELQCPYSSPDPATTVQPTTTQTPAPTKPHVLCSSHHMSVSLPPGPAAGLIVQDINGGETALSDAPMHCGYSVMTGKYGGVLVILPFNSCHVTLQGSQYRVILKYTTLDGWRGEAQLSCPVPAPDSGQECDLPSERRLPCGPASVSAVECRTLGCCICPGSGACYYPMDECTADRHFVFSVPASLTDPPLHLGLLVVAGNDSCTPQRVNRDYALFKIPLDGCGAHRYEVGQTVIYMLEILNTVQSITLNYGTITRDSPLRLLIECRYLPGPVVSVGYLVKSPSLGPSIHAQGVFGVQLRIATDQHYSSYYPQYHRPLRLLLGRPLYLEVRLLNPPDPGVLLLVHYCVAYPRSAQSAWVLIYDGCPNPLDASPQHSHPSPSPPEVLGQTRRFTVTTFQFLPSGEDSHTDEEEIYFMCSTEVCSPTDGPCVEGCFSSESTEQRPAQIHSHVKQ